MSGEEFDAIAEATAKAVVRELREQCSMVEPVAMEICRKLAKWHPSDEFNWISLMALRHAAWSVTYADRLNATPGVPALDSASGVSPGGNDRGDSGP